MRFFDRSRIDQVLIFETFGRPLTVARTWSLIPFPCCQSAKRFTVGECKFKFESSEIQTKDGKSVCMVVSSKFAVDTSSKDKIMKAYKEFSYSLKPMECNESGEHLDITYGVIDILSECIAKQTLKMTLDEIIKFNWLFVDSVFTTAKSVLFQNCVVLEKLVLEEIKEFYHQPKTFRYKEENVYEVEVQTSRHTSDSNEEITSKLSNLITTKEATFNEGKLSRVASLSSENLYLDQDADASADKLEEAVQTLTADKSNNDNQVFDENENDFEIGSFKTSKSAIPSTNFGEITRLLSQEDDTFNNNYQTMH